MPAPHIGCQMAVRIGTAEGGKTGPPLFERRPVPAGTAPKRAQWLSLAVNGCQKIGAVSIGILL